MPSPAPYTRARLSATLATAPAVGDHQRRAGVLQAAQHAGRGEHDAASRGGRAPRRAGRSRRTASPPPRCRRRRPAAGAKARSSTASTTPMQQREPHAVDALRERRPQVAGAQPAGDRGGRAVGEEDADRDRGGQQRRRRRPSPASCGVPRWPTIAESASRNSGSATRAPKAGTASRQDLAVVQPPLGAVGTLGRTRSSGVRGSVARVHIVDNGETFSCPQPVDGMTARCEPDAGSSAARVDSQVRPQLCTPVLRARGPQACRRGSSTGSSSGSSDGRYRSDRCSVVSRPAGRTVPDGRSSGIAPWRRWGGRWQAQ